MCRAARTSAKPRLPPTYALWTKGRGIECQAGALPRQSRGVQLAQLVVDEREKVGDSLGVAGSDRAQKRRQMAESARPGARLIHRKAACRALSLAQPLGLGFYSLCLAK